MITVPLTSKGIMEFVDHLHQAAANMDAEVDADNNGDQLLGQAFRAAWIDFYAADEWTDEKGKVTGLVALCDDIRSPIHVIDATTDYQRLARFNVRLRELWQMAADQPTPTLAEKVFRWTEPKPDLTQPGKGSSNQIDDFLGGLRGDVLTLAIIVGVVWAIGQAKRR